ncbi:MAG: AAA family ATPase [Pirellulales bacterium]|nr:AAA family ATPase [Pirellulales bacterium]
MTTLDTPDLPSHFRQLLGECRELYVSSGKLIVNEYPDQLPKSPEHFLELMDNLHQALLVKVFITVCEADRRWNKHEKFLAEMLLLHLWNQRLQDEQLKAALQHLSEKALSLKWYALVRPFDQIAPLRERVGELETIVTRLANIIARADGSIKPGEAAHIKMIQDELHRHLRSIPIDSPDQHAEADAARIKTIDSILRDADKLPDTQPGRTATQAAPDKVAVATGAAEGSPSLSVPEINLEDTLAELDRLIGLDNIKHEVYTLTNFLKVQQHRDAAGLPTTRLSLHMVFGGNPGTGKTTVARIVGKIFGAMGVLKKGHLVETDRSGLVAEYVGQTGSKTNKKIDEALDGVLFIDEAYTLISAEGEDPFGHEAVQTLLKRMEDDRDRLVVILAGYPMEMQTLLRSNPGLSSRFSRHLEFVDYTPLEMARIFGLMCDKNHYRLRPLTRVKVVIGLDYLHQRRDRHFGNGRQSRNLFEHAIRRMANRIAEISELSVEQLTMLEATDIEFRKVPAEVLKNLAEEGSLRFHIECPKCDFAKDVAQDFLGRRVRCPKCENDFCADWGSLTSTEDSATDSVS